MTTREPFRLDATAQTTANALEIAYTFHNNAADEAWLLIHMHVGYRNDAFDLDPNRVLASVANGAVVLAQKLPALPELMFVESPYIPLVTVVPPAKTFRQTVRVPLPIKPWNPYVEADPNARSVLKTLPVRFELGFLVAPLGASAALQSVTTTAGPRTYLEHATPEDQQLLAVDLQHVLVPCEVPASP